jgi:hypothetical protein
MPRGPKYPLEALGKLRDGAVDAGTRELAKAVNDRTDAERAQAAAQAACDRAAAEAARAREEEAARLERGEQTVADLARVDAWEVAARTDAERHRERVEQAALSSQRAHEEEQRARGDLATRKAEADVVHKDHARWNARQEQRVLANEEQSAEEAWRRK